MSTVGERLIEGLSDRGVEVVFGIPGVHTVELYRGLASGRIRHVTPRHEQGAGFMADGYARVSGKPGVALVITGPGITNTLTAMGQAHADSVPMLVISGVNRRDSLGRGLGLLHELPDQAAMVRPLCHSETLTDPAELGPALDRAFAAMLEGRPGPVHLEIPTDVMGLSCPPLAPPAPVPALPAATAEEIAAAARMLGAARRPLILAGGGVRHAGAAVAALAEALDAPVVQTVNARGMMRGHPLSVPVMPSLEAARDLIRDSDQILALGTELGQTDYDVHVDGRTPPMEGMIRVDSCEGQLGRHPARLAIRADGGAFALALRAALPARAAGDAALRAERARTRALAEAGGLNRHYPGMLAMVEAIREAVPGAIIVGDSTQPVYAANYVYDHDRAGGWFNAATGYGALGFGPGAAVGAAVAAPGTPVICLIGDGGLQFSPGELRTALDEALPVTFVVWNNAGFREIADWMVLAQTKVIGCTPSPLAMEPFAAACGLPFARVAQDPQALAAALRAPHEGPRMIEVQVP